MYPTQLWRGAKYRVVFGPEEHYQAKQEGWGDEKDPDTEPRHEPNAVTIAALVESDESYEASEALSQVRVGPSWSELGPSAPKRRGRPPKVQSIQGVA